jgi:phenylalanyl-tRNA synthetase beta chain
MPAIKVRKSAVLEGVGRKMCDEEVDELCFQFGVELDEVVPGEEVEYKIDIPANRYDLLCEAGLICALKCFVNGTRPVPPKIKESGLSVQKVSPNERKYISMCVIREVDLRGRAYRDLIDFQDKLHLSIGQDRALAAIGTHDYDRAPGPYVYTEKKLEEISFVPLGQKEMVSGGEFRELYKKSQIYKYLRYAKEKQPVLYGGKNVISIPPVINSDLTKISEETRNLLVEVTGTDVCRVKTTMDLLVSHFGAEVEYIAVLDGEKSVEDAYALAKREFSLSRRDVQRDLLLDIDVVCATRHLERMMHMVKVNREDNDWEVRVFPSALRSDVIHVCDLIEDIAISHGYNNFGRLLPEFYTSGKESFLGRTSDSLRMHCAMLGFSEVFTMALISGEENSLLGENGNPVVILKNPKSSECEMVRVSLIPPMLKCISSNQHFPTPIKLFEVSDVCILDENSDTGTRNARRFCMSTAGIAGGIEELQQAFDVVMKRMGVSSITFREKDVCPFLPGRSAVVLAGGREVGVLGIIDPESALKMSIPLVCSLLEVEVEPLLHLFS